MSNTTSLFTTHRVSITAKLGQPIKLIPFGDVHRDSDMHADTHWGEFLDYARKQKNAVFLGMGDYTDGISGSERIVINGLHDTTKRTMDKAYDETVKSLTRELSFMRGRILGCLGGNHYWINEEGTTNDHVLAANLGCRFLGVCSFIRLNIDCGMDGKAFNLDIFAHHGKGGGSTPGGSFNSVEKMANTADADIYLMGHNHAKGCIPSNPRVKLANNGMGGVQIQERTPWLGRTGSFLKVYESGRVSYNVDAARSANALGWIEFELTPVRERRGGTDICSVRIRGTA